MAFKMKGFSGFKSSPAKQKKDGKAQGPETKKNIDLIKGERKGTDVYKGKNRRERLADYDERAGVLEQNELMDLEGDNSPEANKRRKELKKTIATLDREADIIRAKGINKKPPFNKKNWSKKKVKKKEDKVKKLTGKYKKLREKRKEGGQDPSKKQKRAGRKAVRVSNRQDKLERKIYEKSGRKAAEEKRFIQIQKSLNKIEKAKKDPEYIKYIKNR